MAGIQTIEPGFKRFEINPAVVGDLSWVQAKLETGFGTIQSSWKKEDSGISFTIQVPTNTTAEISLPNSETRTVGSGTYTFNVLSHKKSK